MWALKNQTSYQAERGWVVDKTGAKHWIVIVKGTFAIQPDGTAVTAEEAVNPLLAPEYRGEPGKTSLRYEADLTGPKPATDVLVEGHAHSQKAVIELPVAMTVGKMRKVLVVRGNRTWRKNAFGQVVMSDPEPFLRMPIVYERAFGGADLADPLVRKQKIDQKNPVGTGVAAAKDSLVGKPVANIEHYRPAKDGAPAGYGPLASDWLPRRERAGTYDRSWFEAKRPLLPDDFSDRFYNCAPDDQQFTPHLRGGEPVEVVNMSPIGTIRTTLPRLSFGFTTVLGARKIEHRGNLQTVIIEPDHPRLIMVWKTSLHCRQVDALDYTVIRQKKVI